MQKSFIMLNFKSNKKYIGNKQELLNICHLLADLRITWKLTAKSC